MISNLEKEITLRFLKARKNDGFLNVISIFSFIGISLGVAVLIDASHQCMTTRGVHKPQSSTVTRRMLGVFKENAITRTEFMNLIHSNSNQS